MTTVHTGSRTQIVYAEETTYKQTPSNAGNNYRVLPFTGGESLINDISSHVSDTIRSDRMIPGIAKGQHAPGGSIPFELTMPGYVTFFYHALGGKTSIAGSGPATQALYGAADEPTGLFIEKQFTRSGATSIYLTYHGAKVNGFDITIPEDGIVTGTWDVMAAVEDSDTTATGVPGGTTLVSPDSDNPLTSLKLSSTGGFHGYVQIDGSDFTTIQSGRITLTNNAQRVGVISSNQSYAIEFGRREITGEVQIVLIDATHYEKFIDNDDISLRFRFDADLTPSGGSTPNSYIEFYFPKVRWGGTGGRAPTPTIDDPGPLSLTLPFQALRAEDVTTVTGDVVDTDIVINLKATSISDLNF